MNEIIEQSPNTPATNNPFSRMLAAGGGVNNAVVAVEQERAIAEAQGKMALAKRFPRSMAQAHVDFMEACKIPEFAAVAFYSVPNRGSGPSIRFAEEAARCYGNFDYGHRELSRGDGKSVVEVYAWDMEKNNFSRRQLTIEHIVDTKNGPKVLRDQADIDNRIANVASKQIRGRILALLPKGILMAGQAECRKTLAGDNDKPIAQRVRDMSTAFAKFGVTIKHLEEHLKHPVDTTTLDELVDLTGIYNAIKEGAKASEYFTLEEKTNNDNTTGAALTEAAKQRAAAASSPAPSPAQEQAASPPPPAEATKKSSTGKGAAASAQAKPAKEQQPAQSQPQKPEQEEPEQSGQGSQAEVENDDVF